MCWGSNAFRSCRQTSAGTVKAVAFGPMCVCVQLQNPTTGRRDYFLWGQPRVLGSGWHFWQSLIEPKVLNYSYRCYKERLALFPQKKLTLGWIMVVYPWKCIQRWWFGAVAPFRPNGCLFFVVSHKLLHSLWSGKTFSSFLFLLFFFFAWFYLLKSIFSGALKTNFHFCRCGNARASLLSSSIVGH